VWGISAQGDENTISSSFINYEKKRKKKSGSTRWANTSFYGASEKNQDLGARLQEVKF